MYVIMRLMCMLVCTSTCMLTCFTRNTVSRLKTRRDLRPNLRGIDVSYIGRTGYGRQANVQLQRIPDLKRPFN